MTETKADPTPVHRSYPVPGPHDDVAERQSICPLYIVDTAPGGGGLGVWVLTEQTPDFCDYAYVGSPSG
ncbi:MAG: hypothetical protein DI556_04085 [Rhodovulum sulfidophilum]|uniref:Uncharacterized protein n=1 Tax=Rhodovulum sulfidophilum TaxID=35806 RepID=A0A2W5NDY5_RHOSU|nr:MAG: hypothetical protein DI556_04085 [Rhodovulum sulfidophilum]